MANIVLAHGILGYGGVFPLLPVYYFNAIKPLFESHGHKVICPTVAAIGSISVRAPLLEAKILAEWGHNNEPIFILAHSMGGLDSRRVIAHSNALQGRVKRLITIATPHFGSPVANKLLSTPLSGVLDIFGGATGGLADLDTRIKMQDESHPGVEYLCIGCDSTKNGGRSKIFTAAEFIGGLSEVPNDGVVSLTSSSNTNDPSTLWQTWELDHGEAIGWPSQTPVTLAQAATKPSPDHLDRYQSLLDRLIA
jgi:triacylglycerol lipase